MEILNLSEKRLFFQVQKLCSNFYESEAYPGPKKLYQEIEDILVQVTKKIASPELHSFDRTNAICNKVFSDVYKKSLN